VRTAVFKGGPHRYGMDAVPMHLKDANDFIRRFHRHSLPTVGGKFAVGCKVDGKLVGVAVAGRPVCRRHDDGRTLEVLRVCTDGTPNACSWLYARTAKVARLLGYTRVLTYSLEQESGASLKAVGARVTGRVEPQEWNVPSRPRRSQSVYKEPKVRWDL
jgi:hypothetical protein